MSEPVHTNSKDNSLAVKQFYTEHHDRIINKRYNSPYWLRRYAHRQIHVQFLPYLESGQSVLDAGCGEGILSCMVAQKGAKITGVDISAPNIQGASRLAKEWQGEASFLQADAEALPFTDESFDVVLSSHVLEHLPYMERGLRELRRVSRSRVLIAMPTCINPACWVLLGGGIYWKFTRRSIYDLPLGFGRVIAALLMGKEGPNEGYGGNKDAPHIWRFPWRMRQRIAAAGLQIVRFEAGPLIMPYLAQYVPLMRPIHEFIDKNCRSMPLFHEMGYGSMAVCEKI